MTMNSYSKNSEYSCKKGGEEVGFWGLGFFFSSSLFEFQF